MITFVTFHVEAPPETVTKLAQNVTSFRHQYNYNNLCRLALQSAKFHHADARLNVLTDEATPFEPFADIEVRRYAIDASQIMWSRLQAELDFMRQHDFASDLVILDSDMLVNASLEPLFAEDFDVALTYRDHKDVPINGGVLFVKRGRRASALEFFDAVHRQYEANFRERGAWWGDQQALIAVLGDENFAHRASDEMSVGNVKVRLLPCEIYNFTPERAAKAILHALNDKVILHFKASRKRLMLKYFQIHLAPLLNDGDTRVSRRAALRKAWLRARPTESEIISAKIFAPAFQIARVAIKSLHPTK